MKESLGYRKHWRGFSVRQDPFIRANGHTKCGRYLLASSLAAALLGTRRVSARQGWAGEKSGLFEHPAWTQDFPAACWKTHDGSSRNRMETSRGKWREARGKTFVLAATSLWPRASHQNCNR